MCYLLWGLFWSATSLTLSVFEAIKLVKDLVEQERELCCGLSMFLVAYCSFFVCYLWDLNL